MERIFYKPQKIVDLEKEIKSGNKNVLNNFWDGIKRSGTPIIEKIDDNYSNVTLIYREKLLLKNVILIPPVGMRKIEKCIMDKIDNTDLWYISYKVRNDICFTYEFSPNDALDNDWNRRWKNVVGDEFNKNNFKYINKESKTDRYIPYVKMQNSRKRIYIKEHKEINKGIIHKYKIRSKILNEERKFTVYAPYGYDRNKEYGVVILNDGMQYLNMLNAVNVFDNLIYKKEIPPMLAVFIESTSSREKDMKCNDKYEDFISNELIAELKNMYRISENPSKNIIGGYSLGGLFASHTALKHNNIFGNVISQSGSYWYKRENYNEEKLWIINEFLISGKKNINFYINVGAIEPQKSMKETNIEFKEFLKKSGYNVCFEQFGSGHDYIYWGETLADGLKFLLN